MRRIDDQRTIAAGKAALGPACLLAALALAACGGGGAGVEALEEGTAVNPVEAMLAIDDVRVAGVPLSSVPRGTDLRTLPARAAAPANGDAASEVPAESGIAAGDPAAGAGGAASGGAARPGGSADGFAAAGTAPAAGSPGGATAARPRRAVAPLARLAIGDRLVVDMEVADAPAGSQVTVVWTAPDGRPVWRQRREVGDGPRLAFSADTARWPAALYRGEIRYGRETLHRFAVQVGSPAPQVIAGGRGSGLAGRPGAGAVGSTVASLASGASGAAPGDPAAPATPSPVGSGPSAPSATPAIAATAPRPGAAAPPPPAPAEPAATAPAGPSPEPEDPDVVEPPDEPPPDAEPQPPPDGDEEEDEEEEPPPAAATA